MNKNNDQLLQEMKNVGVIPVFNHSDLEICKNVLDATYLGGIRVFEFTNRAENSLEIFSKLRAYGKKYEDLSLGIGTIFTKTQTQQFIDAGADFVVSPALINEVIETCKQNNIVGIPGCATLTEVSSAMALGCNIVKAFPGNLLGPAFVKAIKSVLPTLEVMPTGGVKPTHKNLSEWFDAGVLCVGMGSQLFDKSVLEKGNYNSLTDTVQNTIKIIKELR